MPHRCKSRSPGCCSARGTFCSSPEPRALRTCAKIWPLRSSLLRGKPWTSCMGLPHELDQFARRESVALGARLHHERRRWRGDSVHRGAAVVDGRKPWLHALGEAERRLRQRVEPAKLLGGESEVKRFHVVLELCEPPRADNRRSHAG